MNEHFTADVAPALATVGPYLGILLGAALPTQVWRWIGVLFAGRLDDSSEVFTWVKAVATALVASVIAKLVLDPTGPLAETPTLLRVAAATFGFGAYVAAGRRLAVGIAAAEAVLIGGWLILR